jgi:hypothetical protein
MSSVDHGGGKRRWFIARAQRDDPATIFDGDYVPVATKKNPKLGYALGVAS